MGQVGLQVLQRQRMVAAGGGRADADAGPGGRSKLSRT